MPFEPAVKESLPLKMALFGPSNSGKTYSALRIGQYLGDRIALVDTEHGSSKHYADEFDFDIQELETHHPEIYEQAIEEAEEAGYDVLIIDTLSHEWKGKDGALRLVDKKSSKYNGNSYAAWGDVTPLHESLIDTILAADLHIIATMRAKTKYEVQGEDGKMDDVVKIGLAPIQRDDVEYEFDVVGKLDHKNRMSIVKTRCSELHGEVIEKPGGDLAKILTSWLEGGRGKDELLEKMHALGTDYYDHEDEGPSWDEKRPELVEYYSDGRTNSSKELRLGELKALISGLKEKLANEMVGKPKVSS